MSKSIHNKMYDGVRREILKAKGMVHLPPNKIEETPKTAYKRQKLNKNDFLNMLEEEDID